MIAKKWAEPDCSIEHEGKKLEAGGAWCDGEHLCAYPKAGGVLGNWHGSAIGSWRIVASWPVRSFMGTHMHQIEATVGCITYTGRGFGEGMVFNGKRKKEPKNGRRVIG